MIYINGATMWEWQFGRVVFQIVKLKYRSRKTRTIRLWLAPKEEE